MLDIGWSELLLIGAVALVIIGPKDLPRALRGLGQTTAKLRRMAGEFQRQFNDALQEADMADLRQGVSDVVDTARDLKTSLNPVDLLRTEIRDAIEGAGDRSGKGADAAAGAAASGGDSHDAVQRNAPEAAAAPETEALVSADYFDELPPLPALEAHPGEASGQGAGPVSATAASPASDATPVKTAGDATS